MANDIAYSTPNLGGFCSESFLHKFFTQEDFFLFKEIEDKRAMIVVDGVTRDPKNLDLFDLSSLTGKIKFYFNYPLIRDPAQQIARIFAERYLFYLELLHNIDNYKELLRAICNSINNELELFNKRRFPFPDYKYKDLAGCVGAGALINRRKIDYFFICDSGFALISKEGKIKYKTPNEMIRASEHIPGFSWNDARFRQYWRKNFRNKPENKSLITGEKISFGVFTGEPETIHYLKTGEIEAEQGDIAVVFTDGLEGILFPELKISQELEKEKKNGDWHLDEVYCCDENSFQKRKQEVQDMFARKDFWGLRHLCKKQVKTEGSLCYAVVD